VSVFRAGTETTAMGCSDCDGALVIIAVPADLREHANGSETAAICARCLSLHEGVGEATTGERDLSTICEGFPTDPEAAVPMAMALGLLLDSLALNRDAVETLLERVERAGVDPLLVVDRLLADPSVEPADDLERRRHQLEQLRE